MRNKITAPKFSRRRSVELRLGYVGFVQRKREKERILLML